MEFLTTLKISGSAPHFNPSIWPLFALGKVQRIITEIWPTTVAYSVMVSQRSGQKLRFIRFSMAEGPMGFVPP